jgi:hypothetical protein
VSRRAGQAGFKAAALRKAEMLSTAPPNSFNQDQSYQLIHEK